MKVSKLGQRRSQQLLYINPFLSKTMVNTRASTARALLPNGYPSIPAPLTSFELFPELPVELRHKIWDEACCVPRIINLKAYPLSDNGDEGIGDAIFDGFGELPIHIITLKDIPSTLHTTHEARLIALKHYKLDFGYEFKTDKNVYHDRIQICINIEPRTYVNWSYDVVCIHQDPRYDRESIRSHAVVLLLEYLEAKPLSRIAVNKGLVITLTDQLCRLLATGNGTEVILYEEIEEYRWYQLDPVLDCDRNRRADNIHWDNPHALRFISGVLLYHRRTNKPYGTDFAAFAEYVDLVTDGVDRIYEKTELNRLKSPTVKPMIFVQIPIEQESRVAHLVQESEGALIV